MGIEIQTPGAGVTLPPQASLQGFGSVTAPAALGIIATVSAPPAGTYQVDVYYNISGTVTAAELNNLRVNSLGGPWAVIPVNPVANAAQAQPPFSTKVTCDGTHAVTAVAVGAGGVAAVYNVQLCVTRIG